MVKLEKQHWLGMYTQINQKDMDLLSIMKKDMRKLHIKEVIEKRLMEITSWLIKNNPELTKNGYLED